MSIELHIDGYMKNVNSKTKKQATTILDEIVKNNKREKAVERFRQKKGLHK
ncbi:hypothetical protein LJB88_02090 [Erysipelotrichaceae bacterium OttesenSCG-928-M19]|nr:hypothetical protein [Erysipelotrichaceae bacterium OttesenSCG-928-M19]